MSDELQELTEDNLDALMACDAGHDLWPKAWATLNIDVRLMDDEQRDKVWEAERLLSEAGVGFDRGMGCGAIDWELDWSLRGASLVVRPLYCHWQECPGYKERTGLTTAYWSLTRRLEDGWLRRMPYCSTACRELDDAKHFNGDTPYEFVLHDSASALSV